MPSTDPPPLPLEADSPLTAWLKAVLWGAFLIPTSAFLAIAWWGYQGAQKEAQQAATHASDLAYRQAQRTLGTALEIAQRADAASAGDDTVVRANEAQIHQRLADMAAGIPSIVNLNVWDKDGKALARSDVYPVNPSSNVLDRSYFQEQRSAPHTPGISEVILGRQTGILLTNASIRRSSPDGSFRGVVAVSVSPAFFSDYYKSLASEDPNLATFALIRTDGAILARWPKSPDGRTRVPAGSVALKRISEGGLSGVEVMEATAGRESRVVSFRRVEGFPVYVIAGFSRNAMLAGWLRFVAILAAVLGPTTIVLVYVSWVALKKTRSEHASGLELREQIRRRAAAEKSMIESQKLETLAVVTSGIAHDFNNLLAIVNSALHILKHRHPALADETYVQALSRAVASGVRLTRQLLSFSRRQALRPERISLQTWLPATEGFLRSSIGSKVSWTLSVDPACGAINVDVGELELALINLIVNARHAMPKGGSLRVAVGEASERAADGRPCIAISVTDSGVGIAPQLLDKVFEPFFSTRAVGVGSGLGLSQVQGFCVQAGGQCRIDSQPGIGTTVWMLIPRDDGDTSAAASEPRDTSDALQGKILVVEDNADVSATTELVLRTAGLDVSRAASADAAFDMLTKAGHRVDVVLSDISMPGTMSGIDLAGALRAAFPSLPVVLITGYTDHLNEATAAGFRVLPKPISPEGLLAELKSALRHATV